MLGEPEMKCNEFFTLFSYLGRPKRRFHVTKRVYEGSKSIARAYAKKCSSPRRIARGVAGARNSQFRQKYCFSRQKTNDSTSSAPCAMLHSARGFRASCSNVSYAVSWGLARAQLDDSHPKIFGCDW
jgi:hypothetical protein